MANRDAYDVTSPRSDVQLVTLALTGAGAAALVPADPGGIEFDIVSVTRTGVGVHDIVLRHPYAQLLNVVAGSHGSTAGLHARVSDIDVVAKTLTVELETFGDGTAAAYQTGVVVAANAATLPGAGVVTQVIATTGTITGPKEIIASGTPNGEQIPVWSTIAVAGDTSGALPAAGFIAAVELRVGGVTGPGNLTSGAPSSTLDVQVSYDAAGVPTLNFLAADAVTSAKYTQIKRGDLQRGQVTVTYASGIPTLTFAAADAVTAATVMQVPGDASAGNVDAASGDTIYLTLVVRNSKLN